MQKKQVLPLTLMQVPRWRMTRLVEMVQRGYRAEEVEAELNGWLATGIERIPDSFNLPAAAARAAHAVNASGESLGRMLPTGQDGLMTAPSRDLVETAIFAALAPHMEQLVPDTEELRAYQCTFGYAESVPEPTFEPQ